MNNRADRRDDGLRHDRHPDRTRGELLACHITVSTMLMVDIRTT